MKLIAVLSMLCFPLFTYANVTYTIIGKMSHTMDGEIVYMSLKSKKSNTPQDSAIIEKGTFVLSGTIEYSDMAMLYTKSTKGKDVFNGLVCVENGTTNVDFSDVNHPVYSGGVTSDALNEYVDSMSVYDKMSNDLQLYALAEEYNKQGVSSERQKEILNAFNKVHTLRSTAMRNLLEKNRNNVLGAFLFMNIKDMLSAEEAEKIILESGEQFRNYPPIVSIHKLFIAAKACQVGNKYTDFELPDKTGKLHKLSEYIGESKYVLIDFWASWCAPCRAEMPYLKRIYDQFHDKGFEVIGISLDNNKEQWLKAIDNLNLTWIHLSDLQGNKTEIVKRYHIRSIPYTLLIGPDGIIIGSNCRGEQLEQKLSELIMY